jgi:hypothetical protein
MTALLYLSPLLLTVPWLEVVLQGQQSHNFVDGTTT